MNISYSDEKSGRRVMFKLSTHKTTHLTIMYFYNIKVNRLLRLGEIVIFVHFKIK